MTHETKDNVITVTPRRRMVMYKGLHGWLEYRPRLKVWQFKLKLQHTTTIQGECSSENEAELELKRKIEVALSGKNKNVRTVD